MPTAFRFSGRLKMIQPIGPSFSSKRARRFAHGCSPEGARWFPATLYVTGCAVCYRGRAMSDTDLPDHVQKNRVDLGQAQHASTQAGASGTGRARSRPGESGVCLSASSAPSRTSRARTSSSWDAAPPTGRPGSRAAERASSASTIRRSSSRRPGPFSGSTGSTSRSSTEMPRAFPSPTPASTLRFPSTAPASGATRTDGFLKPPGSCGPGEISSFSRTAPS